jgi:heme-degrading monooxygenase HmoA
MVEVVKHLESVSQWKKADDLREQEKKEEKSQAVLLQNQNVKYMITENQYLR